MSLKKNSRSKSSDPNQEKLREQKASWNQDVSALISDLISLKKGINGRGDIEKNIPTSNIKDPLPTEVEGYLSHVNSNIAQIMQEGHSIIENQRHYSATRRKAKLAAILDPQLKVEATWWGSRAYAKIRLFFTKITKEQRRLRINAIYNGSEILKDLVALYIILNDKDVSKGLNKSGQISIKLISVLKNIKSFLELNDIKTKVQDETGTTEKSSEDGKLKSSPKVDAPVTTLEDKKLTSKQIEFFQNELDIQADIFIKLLKSKLSDEQKSKFEKLQKNSLDVFKPIFSKFTSNPDNAFSEKELSELKNLHTELFEFIKSLVPEASEAKSITEVVEKIPTTTASGISAQQMQKIASNILSRWMKRHWMSFFGNFEDRKILDVMTLAEESRKSLNKLVSALESPNTESSDFVELNNQTVNDFNLYLSAMVDLANFFKIEQRKKVDDKDYRLGVNFNQDLVELNKQVKIINSFTIKDKQKSDKPAQQSQVETSESDGESNED